MHHLLSPLLGSWSGTYRVWLEAADPWCTCESRAHVDAHGDNVIVLDYEWSAIETAHQGVALIAVSDDRLSMAWVDSFHTPQGPMMLTPSTNNSVFTQYGPVDAPWGWRTVVTVLQPDEFEISSFNVTPDGDEILATHALYRREVVAGEVN